MARKGSKLTSNKMFNSSSVVPISPTKNVVASSKVMDASPCTVVEVDAAPLPKINEVVYL